MAMCLSPSSTQIPGPVRSVFGYAMQATMRRADALGVSANRITLLRDKDRDGVAEARKTFMAGLKQPFGMALLGRHFLCRQHRRRRGFPLRGGRGQHHGTRAEARQLQAGRALDTQPADEPRRKEALCRCRLTQQYRRERHGSGRRPRRRLRARSRRAGRAASSRVAYATQSVSHGSHRLACSGPSSTSATASATRHRPII